MIWEVISLEQLAAMAPDEAAALLAVRRSDGAPVQDAELLAAWLKLDPAHPKVWEQTLAGWQAFDDADGDELLGAMRQAALAARPPARTGFPLYRMAAAAVLVLVCGVLFTQVLRGGGGPDSSGPVVAGAAAPKVYATLVGARGQFDLSDGSHMTLDADSRVEVAFADNRRALRLVKGRAFFDVAHDVRRPFVVAAADREVTAVGTMFDVRLDPSRVSVVLIEGKVSVRAPAATTQAILLQAGQQLQAPIGGSPVVSDADLEASAGWREGFVVFNDTPLADAVAELNRGSLDQITIADPAIARLRISGRFQSGDPARFGRTLAQIHPVRMIERGPHRLEIVAAR